MYATYRKSRNEPLDGTLRTNAYNEGTHKFNLHVGTYLWLNACVANLLSVKKIKITVENALFKF